MKILASMLAVTFLVSCGNDSKNADSNEVQLQVIKGEEAAAIDASAKDIPETVVSRIPIVDGVPQLDKAELVVVDSKSDLNNPDSVIAAYDASADSKEGIAELDQDSSSDSFFHGRYRWGYNFRGCGNRCGYRPPVFRTTCRVNCGYTRPLYYGYNYSFSGYPRAAYRPFNYGYGCRRGGYQYATYTRSTSWYSYGNAGCRGFACQSTHRTW